MMCFSEVQNRKLWPKKYFFFSFFKERYNCNERCFFPVFLCIVNLCTYSCLKQMYFIFLWNSNRPDLQGDLLLQWVCSEMSFKQMTYLRDFVYKSESQGIFLWNMHWCHKIALVSRTYSPYIFIQCMNIWTISGPNKYQQESNPLV